jgi:phage-related protein
MLGVCFGNKHSYKDYGLKWISDNLTKPESKKYTFEVPGRDGLLDATESMGPVRYNNRTLTLEFDKQIKNHEEFKQLENRLLNDLQGKVLRIILDTDLGYYYDGRLTIETKTENNTVATVTITADVLPYKLKSKITKKIVDVYGSGKISVGNARMPTVPTIIVDSDVTITFGDISLSFSEGEYRVPDFMLLEGENKFTTEGNAKIIFEYQEGEF